MAVFLAWFFLTALRFSWIAYRRPVNLKADYRTADRHSAGIAPRPEVTKEAVIEAYAARAFSWRGLIASHCWIAVKPENAPEYTVYQVVGWRIYANLPALSILQDIPDRYWYGERPRRILHCAGPRAVLLIPKLDHAARTYPDAHPYTLWPGPNSNTFPAYIGRVVPELRLCLPADAVGKDYLTGRKFFARAPSGTGYQFSLYGIVGILVAAKEGVEINLLGLVYGIRFFPPAIILPGSP